MANVKLVFYDTENDIELMCFQNLNNNIHIVISDDYLPISIELDKSTAIKLAKTLRTEINKITEVENG